MENLVYKRELVLPLFFQPVKKNIETESIYRSNYFILGRSHPPSPRTDLKIEIWRSYSLYYVRTGLSPPPNYDAMYLKSERYHYTGPVI